MDNTTHTPPYHNIATGDNLGAIIDITYNREMPLVPHNLPRAYRALDETSLTAFLSFSMLGKRRAGGKPGGTGCTTAIA